MTAQIDSLKSNEAWLLELCQENEALKCQQKLEQEGESLHNSVNQELRQLYCIRNPCQKLKLVLRRQELWSKSDRKLLDCVGRLCSDCKDAGLRSFLKNGKCLVCDKVA